MAKIRRTRTKACDLCSRLATVMYRVKTHRTSTWQLVCDRCWPSIRSDHPGYTYGGTWKAHKRH